MKLDMKLDMKRFWRRSVLGLLLGILLTVLPAGPTAYGAAQAGQWMHDGQGWWYLYEGGWFPYGGWFQDTDGRWYYFDSQGYMQTGWVSSNGCWYYLDPSGARASGWRYLDGGWYYFSSSGAMRTGWVVIDGSRYYLGSGRLYTNCELDGGYCDENGVWHKKNAGPGNEPAGSSEIEVKLAALKERYPSGRYWNHAGLNPDPYAADRYQDSSASVTDTPCDHSQKSGIPELDALRIGPYCNQYIGGFQCDGFALKLIDEIYPGGATEVILDGSFADLSVGDYVRFNDFHSVIVIAKTDADIQVAECNYRDTCEIHWGRSISKDWIDNSSMVIITGKEN